MGIAEQLKRFTMDKTAQAALLQERIDWARFPKLAATFQHRSPLNQHWHELAELVRSEVELALAELEEHGA